MTHEIECGLCRLRPWRAGDESTLVLHANNREVWLNLRDRFPHPYTPADARAWIQAATSRDPPTDFAIEVSGEAVGGVGVKLHEDVDRVSAELGYWLGRTFWGRGIMPVAVRAATEYAFSSFGLTRVYALPYARNPASIRVLDKAGYVREALLRRSAIKDGVVLDQVLLAITDQDLARAPITLSMSAPK